MLRELDYFVGQNGVDLIGHGFKHVLQELPSGLPVCLLGELGYGKLTCAINACEHVELAFSSLNLGDVDMEQADGVAFELLALRLVTFHIRQARDAMPLKAPLQRRTGQMRDGRLQSIKSIAQRQQCMPSECDNGRLLGFGQDRRAWILRPSLQLFHGLAFAPLR